MRPGGYPRLRNWLIALVPALLAATAARAQDSPPKSPPDALRQYRDAVALQNRGVYDLAVDEWEKFAKQFPDDPLLPKARHYEGVCKLQLKKFDEAIAIFKDVVQANPKFELLESTYLNLGLAQFSKAQAGDADSYGPAAETFNALLAKYPDGKQAAQAVFYLGESYYALGKKPEAAQFYSRLVAKYPKSALRPDALYALGVTQEETGQAAEAGATYDTFLKEFASHALRTEVVMRRGETLFAARQFPEAEKLFAQAAAVKDFALADQATLRQAASLHEQKKYPEAAALYASVSKKFPKSASLGLAALGAGSSFYLAGNVTEAQKWLAQAMPAGGDVATEASHWLARVLLKQNQAAAALQIVEKALPKAGESPFAVNLLLDQADAVYEIANRRGDAQKLYADLAAKNPDHPLAAQALYMAGYTALGQGDYTAAQAHCDVFLKAHADDPLVPDVKYVAAEVALQLNDYTRAERLYEDLLDKYASHSEVDQWRIRRLFALYLEKKYPEVIAGVEKIAAGLKGPDLVAEAQYLLGSSRLELRQYDAAAKALLASLAAQPKWRQADETLLNLAAAYRQLNKLPEATAAAQRVLAEFPQSKSLDRAHYLLGECLNAAGDASKAATEFQLVIDKWPSSPLVPYAIAGLGWAQLGEKQFEGAAETLNALIDKYPSHPAAARGRYARSMARQQLQDFAAAREDVQAFLESKPEGADKLDAMYILGLCQVGLKEYAKGADVFQAILKEDPKYAGADKVLYELAWALKSADKEAEAAKVFGQLTSEHTDSPLLAESLFHVGEFHYQAKDYAQAARDYYAALGKAGRSELGEKIYHKLAWAYYQQGQFDKAQKSFDDQAATYPQGELAADALFMSGESLFKQNKHQPAIAAYTKSLARPPANQEFQALAYLHAAQANSQLKKWNDSLKLLDKAAADFPDSPYLPELLYEQGWAKQNTGKLDDAAKLYERAAGLTEREVSARARFMLGELLFQKKDYTEAVRNFFKVAYGFGAADSAEPVKKWQADAVFEAGRCFEVMKRLNEAKKSYKEVLEKYPKSDKAPLAKARLDVLGS